MIITEHDINWLRGELSAYERQLKMSIGLAILSALIASVFAFAGLRDGPDIEPQEMGAVLVTLLSGFPVSEFFDLQKKIRLRRFVLGGMVRGDESAPERFNALLNASI